MDRLLTLYPQDITQGSPYDTGTENAFTPEFKRIASLLGDFVFQAPRRFLLNNLSEKQNIWSFCTSHIRIFPLTRAGPYLPLTRRFSRSKQAPEVAARTWLSSRVRYSEYLWRGRPDALPNPICHEPGSQRRWTEPAMAAVHHLVSAIIDAPR